ncbi:lysophospholipase L1-like esterase [Labedella gwakjiensis]|uniref:GDSL family lipase n=1 Tax=Labedella gwakjiensis TaxID=390269 RepID=A0A2P8GT11_9MICO|nr:SGNH/GDSL hydrolase family protein [Labedella gwakjiensis]PSL37082.1 lysophospholipase L1-like esterase [Labedella gwakjiensis]RUQ82013.1 GDSL family lipase [Labedella gwakjiensis]
MAITIGHGTRVLFTGDSITDAGRRDGVGDGLGDGYVRRLADSREFDGVDVVNTGVGGDRVVDLLARLSDDVLAHRPDVLSILVGINDTWRRYDDHDETSVEDFTSRYRTLLTAAREAGFALVLVEPFVLPVLRAQKMWREDLDPKIEAVRALAAEFDAVLVPADVELGRLAAERGAPSLAEDGVHPTPEGHDALAALWLRTVLSTDDEEVGA